MGAATQPKWMQWHTYNRHVEHDDAYEAILDYGIAELLALGIISLESK